MKRTTIVLTLFSCLLAGIVISANTANSSAALPGSVKAGIRAPQETSTAVTPTSTATATPSCLPGLSFVASPNVGSNSNYLNKVTAVAGDDAWAAGYYFDSNGVAKTLIEHWDGNAWSVVTSPNMGTNRNYLNNVLAISSNDVWAVGFYWNSSSLQKTLTEHWDGSAWSIVASPNAGPDENYLDGLSAKGSADVWAVGTYSTGSLQYSVFALHWDGTQWSVVAVPNGPSSVNYLFGVAAISTNDVWAVGHYGKGSSLQTLIEHWDGTSWSRIKSPNVGSNSNQLRAVAAISTADVWASGSYYEGSVERTLLEHWNGTQWDVVSSPSPGAIANNLAGISALTANDIWAAGSTQSGPQLETLVEHWDGTQWAVVYSANPGQAGSSLNGLWANSANDVWAVGNRENGSTAQTLVERYTGLCVTATPTITATPTATACPIQFIDVPPGRPFYENIRCLACRQIISGYPDGTFRPNDLVTRGQLSKIVSNSAGFNDPQPDQVYQDVPVGSTFHDYVGRLASRDVINGYPCGGPGEPCVPPRYLPYFRPNSTATRAQIAKIVSNAAGFNDPPSGQTFEDVLPGSPFYDFIERLASRGVMQGYPCGQVPTEPCVPPEIRRYFRPYTNATRGQTAKIVGNTFFPDCQTPQRH